MKTGAGGRLRVLVVEEEPIAREMLGDLLKMAGYDILSARTGEQALLTLVQERGRLHCLFTAVELPGLVDGWMLADEFRVTDAALPVVFATAKPAEVRRLEGAAFVAHPVLPPKAVEAVKELTNRSAEAVKASPPRIVAETSPPQPSEVQRVPLSGDLKVAVNA